ncbi:helix-turn-helix domain-containing protein [uncultured Mucilaginibacter sp.]|uniref:helix-turn-helix domain-containing protein n=1 Tax=uncultured Mucilaginibacter sp. TaxID=797541 RepID=UPI0025E1640A|nr:helix-turn-helix domain-containing protein [uncultured Mucilaginibacter sp.]
MSIHERIKGIRVTAGLSQEGFAESIGLRRGNYAQIELGNQLPTLETIKIIARNYNKSYGWLIDGDTAVSDAHLNAHLNAHLTEKNGTKTAIQAPTIITLDRDEKAIITVVGTRVAAGYLNGYGDPEFIEKLQTISAPGFTGALHRGFEIKGHSMPPIHPGAISIGRYVEKLSDIANRRVYIIVTRTDGIVIKRVINRPDEGKLILISDNPNKREYPNYTVDYEDIIELWYWRAAFIRELPDPSALYDRMNDLEAELTLIKQSVNQIQGKGGSQIKLNG